MKAASSSKKAKVHHRGGFDDEDRLKFISSAKFVQTYKFNNFGEFLTEESPSEIFDLIDNYRQEIDNNLLITFNEAKKRIIIEEKSKALKLSLKFFKLDDDEEDHRLKMKFTKKSGQAKHQFKLIKKLLTYLEEVIIYEDEEEQQ